MFGIDFKIVNNVKSKKMAGPSTLDDELFQISEETCFFTEEIRQKIIILSDSHLERIFSYLSYHELTEIRIVCRWFYFVIGGMTNRKFRSSLKEIENCSAVEKNRNSPSDGRMRILKIVDHEMRTIESTCWDYISGNMFYFYGGLILDYVDRILSSHQTNDVIVKAAKLFMLVSRFLNTFDSISEPFLLRRSYHLPFSWFGKKLVDTLDNSAWVGHFVTLEPQQKEPTVKWTGKYVAKSFGNLLPPPFVADSSQVFKIELDSILRYVRNAVRWNNIVRIIQSDDDQRSDKRVQVENCSVPRIVSEKSYSTDERSKRNGNPCRMEFNLRLLCHTIFGPSSHKKLIETLSSTDSSDSSESIELKVPEAEDYQLDLTVEITYKVDRLKGDSYRTAIIQICQVDDCCYIASDTMLADKVDGLSSV